MSNAESAKIISEAKKRGQEKALERVSALVDGITTITREIITEAGLETPETIAAWGEKYEHYVPLHRDEVSGNNAHPVGQGFKYPGSESKRAMGSNRKSRSFLRILWRSAMRHYPDALEFYGGSKKRKGRKWLADSGGYNPRRTQAHATLDDSNCMPFSRLQEYPYA